MPLASIAAADTPSFGRGSRWIPRAARLRWSTRAMHFACSSALFCRTAQRSRISFSTSGLFQPRSFAAHPSAVVRLSEASTCVCGLVSSSWRLQSTTIPRAARSWANPRTSTWRSAMVSSRGTASRNSRASCASFRFSPVSTLAQSAWRSPIHSGAWSGRVISEWDTPCFRL